MDLCAGKYVNQDTPIMVYFAIEPNLFTQKNVTITVILKVALPVLRAIKNLAYNAN